MSAVRSSSHGARGPHRATRLVGVAVVCGGLLLSACGSSSGGSSKATTTVAGTSQTKDATLAALVPAKLTKAGKVVVATDASYAPNEFLGKDGKSIEGMDVDLGKAIGAILGVDFQFTNAKFDGIIAGLGTRYDIGMSSFTDSKEREKAVDMVTYFTAGESFMVQKGKNGDITDLASLCGKKVAVEAGTVELDDATAQSKKCSGSKITILSLPTQADANVALSSGRADVSFADTPVNAYAAKQSNGAFEIVGKSFGDAPYGIAIPKAADYKGLSDAILGAVKKLAADGTYKQILDKWGIADGAITDFKINGAIS